MSELYFAPCCDHCGCKPSERIGHDDYCATSGCPGGIPVEQEDTP